MIRRIIEIDEDKCIGCGACADACHEGAIAIVGGKAKLMRDDYCDGLGDCLPSCPADAITFTEREAAEYTGPNPDAEKRTKAPAAEKVHMEAELTNWPVQIKLLPQRAPMFDGAELLVAADCTAYAYGSFHTDFMRGKKTIVGCPKLDAVDYSVKLAQFFAVNDIAAITVARMEVPCCGGLELAVKRAVGMSGKDIPVDVVTITTDGRIK